MNNINIQLPLPIQSNWIIYTKSNCIYCDKVKELLNKEQIITFINCDTWLYDSETTHLFLSQMANIIGKEYRTFPMVFKNNIFIGGFTETSQLLNSQQNSIYFTDDF
jgi:glutaredoxin